MNRILCLIIHCRYDRNLEDAKNFGVKKAISTNVSMGLTQFVIFATYALAFWYGTKLSIDEPENYSIGRVITVSWATVLLALLMEQIHLTGCFLLPLPNCLSLHYLNLTLKKTYAAVRVSVCFISICISICRKCLVLSVVPVHFICFTVGEWETSYRFLCMSWHAK